MEKGALPTLANSGVKKRTSFCWSYHHLEFEGNGTSSGDSGKKCDSLVAGKKDILQLKETKYL